MKLKALLIGGKSTYNFFKTKLKPNWDWQIPLVNVDMFWNAYDNNAIDFEDTDVVVISDEIYKAARTRDDDDAIDDFLELVTQIAENSLTFIVNFFPELRNEISDELHQYVLDNPDIVEKKIYWLTKSTPVLDLEMGMKDYIKSPMKDPDIANDIIDAENIDYYEQDDDDDDEDYDEDYDEEEDEENEYTNNYNRDGMVICVTSSKGGVGKTSTTFGLATWLYQSSVQSVKEKLMSVPLKICVVDLDVRDAQIGSVIGASQPTVLQIILSNDGITQKSVEKNLIHDEHNTGVWYLLAPKMPYQANSIAPAKYSAVISILKKMFDIIILDTSVNYTDDLFMQVAYPQADKIVFVTTLARPSVVGMHKWIYTVGRERKNGGCALDMNKVNIVINQGQTNVKMSTSQLKNIIDSAVTSLYNSMNAGISPANYHRPRIIGAIPEIPGGQLMRLVNIQQYQLSLNIPQYEKYIGMIAKNLMPPLIADNLSSVNGIIK